MRPLTTPLNLVRILTKLIMAPMLVSSETKRTTNSIRVLMLRLEKISSMTQTPDNSPPSITESTTIWPLQLTHITKDQRLELSFNGFHSEQAFHQTTNQTTTVSQLSSELNTRPPQCRLRSSS